MGKLTLTKDGVVIGQWDVTTREDAPSGFAYQLNIPFARTALVNDIRDELARYTKGEVI